MFQKLYKYNTNIYIMNKGDDVAITYCIEEIDNNENNLDFNIEDLMKEIEHDVTVPRMINYRENFNVKELLLICEYYGVSKEMKASNFNKQAIIEYLVVFENDVANKDIVFRRKNMWFYISELKNDKLMKKFILW